MTAPAFHGLDLRAAEEQLIGGCVYDEEALLYASMRFRELGDDPLAPGTPFRSPAADDLTTIFFVLLGWHIRGAFDPMTNEARLIEGLPLLYSETDPLFRGREDWWASVLESCWTPRIYLPGWTRSICDAIVHSNELHDRHVEAARAYLSDNPLIESTSFIANTLYEQLRPAITENRELRRRVAAPPMRANRPGPPPPVDWEAIRKRAKG